MSLYQISYRHFHQEDHNDKVEHDIEADSPLDALLKFLEEYGDVGPEDGTEELQLESNLPDTWACPDEFTVRQLAEAFLTGQCDLDFWPSDSDIFQLNTPTLEDSVECPTCRGRARVCQLR